MFLIKINRYSVTSLCPSNTVILYFFLLLHMFFSSFFSCTLFFAFFSTLFFVCPASERYSTSLCLQKGQPIFIWDKGISPPSAIPLSLFLIVSMPVRLLSSSEESGVKMEKNKSIFKALKLLESNNMRRKLGFSWSILKQNRPK